MTEDYLATSQAPQRTLSQYLLWSRIYSQQARLIHKKQYGIHEWYHCEFSNEEGGKDGNDDDDKDEVTDVNNV